MTHPSKRIPLGQGPEFDLIRRLVGPAGEVPKGVLVGPGDDCAVLEGGVVVSSDLTVEGVHFRREWITLEEAGYRAASAALSDVAAMAAEPLGILLSLALASSEAAAREAMELTAGAKAACRGVGVTILGGDLAESPGSMVVDVVALGRAEYPVLREGSLPGDEVWVTGSLGGSGTAVRLWEEGRDPPPGLRAAFAHPTPRIQEALWLARTASLHALIDLSDGLGGDAGHLAAASGVSIILEEEAVPVHPEAHEALGDGDEALRRALSGGEDYELCFTLAPGALRGAHLDEFQDRFGVCLTRVGTVEVGEGVVLRSAGGSTRPFNRGGYSHFQESEEG